ncbi:transcription initiation factor IIF, beta subunit-domain-containing protein [Neohortaea acidophila]|uniref:Transcription initiation factor IIF subunit beta n=1 Tax=Neohortaea acidophila TaxID=245834 RepID=A0A6A6PKR2_9PEZI|nr:transcription initiation factor IIF, beta subunit-domain-containing protein [Neohortaea acidophila]KAF2480602.1 transcription initiation factor IIF, beta subunit-domain-containing protein [Neohortaea acidophila]
MADTQAKPEIKVDPASSTPKAMTDVEEFEDDVDLYIPPPPQPQGDGPQAWLVKVPKYIWNAWAEIYRNAPDDGGNVEIGKMVVYEPKPGEEAPKTQIRLTPGVYQHVDLPKTYNLDIKTTGYSNTIVFSEKDLPGHRSGRPQPYSSRHSKAQQFQKSRGIPSKADRYGKPVKPGTYRTAIPKQTALAPLIYHVADAAPEEDASYFAYFKKQYEEQLKPKKTTTFFAGIDRSLHPAASHLNAFPSFGLSSRPGARGKKAAPKEKAVRMSQEALLDRIYQCFRRYKYWSLKALRIELRQPEVYIKQTLEGVAVLMRSGDFAMNYVLKPEYQAMINPQGEDGEGKAEPKEETAMVKSEAEESEMEMDGGVELGSEDDDDDDLGEEFEDVKMQ